MSRAILGSPAPVLVLRKHKVLEKPTKKKCMRLKREREREERERERERDRERDRQTDRQR